MREGSTGDARWLLGVEEAGEFLVMEQGEIVIGSEASPEADLKLLAPLQSRHAVLRRATSFHGGCKYLIESCDDAEMRVNDIAVPRAELSDGDRIKLGRSFEMVFRRPCSRSGAARIDLGRSWSVGGCGSLLLLPPSGRAGALLIADRDDAHVRTDGKTGDVELYREASGQLRARGSRGVSLDRAEPCAEVEIGDAAGVSAEDLVLVIGPASI